MLLYTSGTTGHPKGVMNDHRGMMAMTLDTTIATESKHEDIGLATTPFFTTGGVVRALTWMYLGQTILIQPRFDPEALLDSIERDRITFTTFIPTMLIRTLRLLDEGRQYDLSSLRRISYGGAPISREVIEEALARLGCDMQQRYGLTEAGGQFTILTPQDHRDLLAGKESIKSSCGRETPMTEVWIIDDDGSRQPPGRPARSSCGPTRRHAGTGTGRSRPRRRSARKASGRATPAGWTTRATCTSPAARPT